MRAWDSYINLEAAIKDMLTSFRAIGELQNPALRDRHWSQLMVACKKAEPSDEMVTVSIEPCHTIIYMDKY